jgi:hypothetical protein
MLQASISSQGIAPFGATFQITGYRDADEDIEIMEWLEAVLGQNLEEEDYLAATRALCPHPGDEATLIQLAQHLADMLSLSVDLSALGPQVSSQWPSSPCVPSP